MLAFLFLGILVFIVIFAATAVRLTVEHFAGKIYDKHAAKKLNRIVTTKS